MPMQIYACCMHGIRNFLFTKAAELKISIQKATPSNATSRAHEGSGQSSGRRLAITRLDQLRASRLANLSLLSDLSSGNSKVDVVLGVDSKAPAKLEQLEPEVGMQVYALSRVPLIFDDLPRETRMVRLSSRPCPLPVDLASWTVATVLA